MTRNNKVRKVFDMILRLADGSLEQVSIEDDSAKHAQHDIFSLRPYDYDILECKEFQPTTSEVTQLKRQLLHQ